MKKKFYLVLLTIVIILNLGCVNHGDGNAFAQVVRNNVLCTNGKSHGEAVSLDIIEKDPYERTLFSYSMYVAGAYGYGQIYALAICQKYDRDNTYYYEDACFIVAESASNIGLEDINDLKDKNDWGTPLIESKMTSRQIDIDKNSFSRLNVEEIFSTERKQSIGSNVTCRFTDFDKHGKVLFFVVVNDADFNDEVTVTQKYYLMIVSEDGTYNKDTFITEIENLYNYQSQLHSFKEDNGWVFG